MGATGRGCNWTIYDKGEAAGQLVEHVCSGDRFEVDLRDGWLRNGHAVSMFAVLDALPPPLTEWALREAIGAVSDEELTPLGIDVARVVLLAGVVTDLVGDPRRRSRRGLRRRTAARHQREAA